MMMGSLITLIRTLSDVPGVSLRVIVFLSRLKRKISPCLGLKMMDESLEFLKLEAEEERRQRYLERFGFLPPNKGRNRRLDDFN